MRVGITGATGTLGKRLAQKFLERNDEVIALCRNQDSAKTLLGQRVGIVEGDITNVDTLGRFVNNLDACIHLAAQVDHADKRRYWDVNVTGTKNLCSLLMELNPTCRFIYCSSIAVLRFSKMKTNYSLSKAKGEEIVRTMMNRGLPASIIYSGLLFGPGDQRLIPYLVKGLQTGKIPLVSGGESFVPVIYIDDLCELFIKTSESDYAIGKSFLGIQQTSAGMHEFIKIIAECSGYPAPCKKVNRSMLLLTAIIMELYHLIPFVEGKPSINKRIIDILSISYRPSSFDNEVCLGWQPVTSIKAGIMEFFNQNRC
ncbi:MAG TPA: SDR family NAD(P)-dependent oxidoreductase [Chitinispirillaceae bacterium]|nr:SDR family NAD(P)-dependent oxidoreductase [Chitinispirillaceae bacterium]